ncbi:hypothetical protein ACGFJC_47590 [Nonomuraea fuscirosea]|uniref:hypothetical protein n=1 Tax=Nonomuraea fuscirosea TaxID=1291556 RepID=UPI00371FED14
MAVRFSAAGQFYTTPMVLGEIDRFSITMWVKVVVDRNDYSTLWCLDDGTPNSGSYTLLQAEVDGVSLTMYPSGDGYGELPVGAWHYVGFSMSPSGTVVKTRTQGAGAFTTTSRSFATTVDAQLLRLGVSSFSNNAEWLNGSLASVKVWTGAALTAAELETEYLYAAPARTANLRAFYRFDSPSNADNSGNGHTLSGGSGATTEAGPTGLIEPGGGSMVVRGWGSLPVR